MKLLIKAVITVVIFTAVVLVSCHNTWTEDDKNSFHQACMDDAATWSPSNEASRMYCDCVLGKIVKRYPNVNDALEHIEQLTNDPEMKECKQGMGAKEHMPL